MYADIGPSSQNRAKPTSVNHDDHRVEYSELNHTPLKKPLPSTSNEGNLHPAGEWKNPAMP